MVVRKVRGPKRYRITELDTPLRRMRTTHEALMLHEAKKAGVATPFIYLVDPDDAEIIMQYVDGERLREFLKHANEERRIQVCRLLGDSLGRLHNNGIVHGDLTTSNAIVVDENRLFIIDFGLAEYSRDVERQGVDILLGLRVFQSTHYEYGSVCYEALLEGHRSQVGSKASAQIIARAQEIARRGRYAVER
jgi:TP53 regulating kinase-like protein